MNSLHVVFLTLLAVVVLLLLVKPRLGLTVGRFAVLSVVGTIMLLPFIWLVCASFKHPNVLNQYLFLPPISEWSTPQELNVQGKIIPGVTVGFSNFERLFEPRATVGGGTISFWRYILNSVFLASASTVICLFFCSMGGYALAKYKFKGRAFLMFFMLASLTIPGVALLAPSFKIMHSLGWLDTYLPLLIPGAANVFGMFLFRQAIAAIPDDIVEAGRIDGCGEFKIYMTLVMPLVRPMIGAFCLVTFLGAWNGFLGPNIFLQTQSKLTLPVILNQYIGEYSNQYGVFLAGTLLAILPPAILFLVLQKEFIAGLTTGAVKQ
jgi:multiple sugar transport system permease protein